MQLFVLMTQSVLNQDREEGISIMMDYLANPKNVNYVSDTFEPL